MSRIITGIASVCVWFYAAYFALKWFGHMANGSITYNSRATAVTLPVLSVLVLLGAVCSVILLILTRCGKVKAFWQPVMLVLGILFCLLIQGD